MRDSLDLSFEQLLVLDQAERATAILAGCQESLKVIEGFITNFKPVPVEPVSSIPSSTTLSKKHNGNKDARDEDLVIEDKKESKKELSAAAKKALKMSFEKEPVRSYRKPNLEVVSHWMYGISPPAREQIAAGFNYARNTGEALDTLQDQYSRLFLAYTALKAELAE